MEQTGAIISIPPLIDGEEEQDPGSQVEWRHGTIALAQHGQRIDRALVGLLPEFSRSYLQQMLESGQVQINHQRATKAAQRVKAGDALEIEIRPTLQSQAFKPEAMDLRVVYQDEHLLVIDKPAGLVVHPAPGNWSGTLLNGLLALDPQSALLPRAGIVHRLDKDTSGLMVVARSRLAMDALVRAIAAREVSRQYLALAHHPWTAASPLPVQTAIGRDPRNRLRMAVVDLDKAQGKAARTDVVLLGNAPTGCFVRCILHTGRTHQIRVHMASLGHPLVGDGVYGGKPEAGMQRQALHAVHLAFAHPITGVALEFEAPLPTDFAALLQAWSLRYNPLERASRP